MANPTWTAWIEDLRRALAARDRAGANAAVGQLLESRAPLGAQWKSISELMRVSGELTLARNKARQADITSEIVDIAGGAEALWQSLAKQ